MQRQSVWARCCRGAGQVLAPRFPSHSVNDSCSCRLAVGNEQLVKVTLKVMAIWPDATWHFGNAVQILVQLTGWSDGRIGWSCRGGIDALLLIGIDRVNLV